MSVLYKIEQIFLLGPEKTTIIQSNSIGKCFARESIASFIANLKIQIINENVAFILYFTPNNTIIYVSNFVNS